MYDDSQIQKEPYVLNIDALDPATLPIQRSGIYSKNHRRDIFVPSPKVLLAILIVLIFAAVTAPAWIAPTMNLN